jgi:hypothetical protein
VDSVTIKCVAKHKVLGNEDRNFTFYVNVQDIENLNELALKVYENILLEKNLSKDDYRLSLYQ